MERLFEDVQIDNIYSVEFNNLSGLEKAYKQIKQDLADKLNVTEKFTLQKGTIVLLSVLDGMEDFIKITSADKETMKDFIRMHKGNKFKLMIKGRTYRVSKRG